MTSDFLTAQKRLVYSIFFLACTCRNLNFSGCFLSMNHQRFLTNKKKRSAKANVHPLVHSQALTAQPLFKADDPGAPFPLTHNAFSSYTPHRIKEVLIISLSFFTVPMKQRELLSFAYTSLRAAGKRWFFSVEKAGNSCLNKSIRIAPMLAQSPCTLKTEMWLGFDLWWRTRMILRRGLLMLMEKHIPPPRNLPCHLMCMQGGYGLFKRY
jgi:hypothetical protein